MLFFNTCSHHFNKLERDKYLFKQHEMAESLFIIHKGTVKCMRDVTDLSNLKTVGLVLEILTPGDIVGEVCT